jgi:hypothetical protein
MRLTVISILCLLSACHGTHSSSLTYLEQYVGKQPAAVGLWDTEPLHTQLKDLTGDKYDQFVQYMKGSGELSRDRYLYALSEIAQDSTRGYAFILVDTKTNKIQVGIETNVSIQKFQSPAEVFETPAAVQQKLDSIK